MIVAPFITREMQAEPGFVRFTTDLEGAAQDTGPTQPKRPHKEKNMTNARIERMLRELNSEPPVQFFQDLFGLVGLGESRESSVAQPALAAKPAAA